LLGLAFFACRPASASPAAEGRAATSFFEAFFIQKNARTGEIEWLGSGIVWLLLLGSVGSLALMGALAWENRRVNLTPRDLLSEVRSLLAGGNIKAALRRTRDDRSFAGRILHAAMREAEFGREAMLHALDQACEEFTAERLRRVEILNVVGGVAPMIGLFGTVYGMILAFREIVAAGGTPDPVGLAAGIGTALTTTFWGLIVAIPALGGYALIRNTIDALTSEATLEAQDIINHFHSRAAAREATEAAAGQTV